MLETMREDVAVKKKFLAQSSTSASNADEALVKIAESMQTLSQAILSGFQHLNSFQGPSNNVVSHMQAQPQYGSCFPPVVYPPKSNQSQPYPMQQPFTGNLNTQSLPCYGQAHRTPSPSNTSASWDENSEDGENGSNFYQL